MIPFLKKAIWLLPISGLLLTISVALRGEVIDPASDPKRFVQFVTGDYFQLGATFNLFNFLLLFLGVIALGLLLIELTHTTIAKLGFLCMFISHALTFTYLGLLTFIYQKSVTIATTEPFQIFDLFDLNKNTALLPVIAADSITYLGGVILTVTAMLRSKRFTMSVWLLFGLSFLLVGVIPPATLATNPTIARVSELIGNPLIAISGLQIARIVQKPFKN